MTDCVGVCEQESDICLKWQAIFSLLLHRLTVNSEAIHFTGKAVDVTYVVNGGVGTRGSAVSTHANALTHTHTPPLVMSRAGASAEPHTRTYSSVVMSCADIMKAPSHTREACKGAWA